MLLYLAAHDSEAESEAEAVSEAEAEQPQSPEINKVINKRIRAEEFIRRVALRLVLQIGWQNRLPNAATGTVAGYLPGWAEKNVNSKQGAERMPI